MKNIHDIDQDVVKNNNLAHSCKLVMKDAKFWIINQHTWMSQIQCNWWKGLWPGCPKFFYFVWILYRNISNSIHSSQRRQSKPLGYFDDFIYK
jgi:hypothetical protein